MRISTNDGLVLEQKTGLLHDLIDVKTSKKKKKETEEKIRTNIADRMKNNNFDSIRNKKIDLAIVIYLSERNYKNQDCDNIAKPILDALSHKNPNDDRYLIENDAQIIRLLIEKQLQEKIEDADNAEVYVSFREHNPDK